MPLAQDPRNRFIRVVWGSSGVLFLRANYKCQGKIPPSQEVGKVTGMPDGWGEFDIFAPPDLEDPDARKIQAPIVDPVSDAMLAKYYQFAPQDAYHQSQTTTTIDTIWVIDTALWYGVYNHHDNGQVAFGEQHAVEQLLFDGYNSFFGPLDRNLFTVRLADIFLHGRIMQCPGPPDPIFFAAAAVNGWTYHSEPAAPQIVQTRRATSVLIVNVGKIVKLAPLVGGRKPASWTFNVAMNDTTVSASQNLLTTWELAGATFRTKKSNPPSPLDGRRTFPTQDQPGDGERLVPTFPFPDATVSVTNPVGASVDVKVVFKTLEVTMTINGGSVPPRLL